MLKGLPPGATSSCAAEVPLVTLVVGDCLTVNGAWLPIELEPDMAVDEPDRLADEPLERPTGPAPD